jgi:hypothetical protein
MEESAAKVYDLSAYEEDDGLSSRETGGQARPRLTVRSARRRRNRVSPFWLSLCAFALVVLVAVVIGHQAVMIKKGDDLDKAAQQLAGLQSRSAVLKTRIESAASSKKVEEQATVLGMGKMESYQVIYVSLAGEDRIEAPTAKEGGLTQAAMNLYGGLLEYMEPK